MKKLAGKTAPPVKLVQHADHQIIMPRNTLKAKAVIIGDGPPVLDESAIRRAEKALKALSKDFDSWMEQSCEALSLARDAYLSEPAAAATFDAFYRAAHDMKGQAETLGFPLAGRVAASLCLLLECEGKSSRLNEDERLLAGQHVDGIRAITREGITRPDHRIGETLAVTLENATADRLSIRLRQPSCP